MLTFLPFTILHQGDVLDFPVVVLLINPGLLSQSSSSISSELLPRALKTPLSDRTFHSFSDCSLGSSSSASRSHKTTSLDCGSSHRWLAISPPPQLMRIFDFTGSWYFGAKLFFNYVTWLLSFSLPPVRITLSGTAPVQVRGLPV